MNKLEQAARQIIVDWDSGIHLYETITALREALDNSLKPKCFADYQPNHAIDRACASCAVAVECQTGEQAEQSQLADVTLEPVACIIHTEEGDFLDWNSKGYCFYTGETPLYAAPLAKQDTHATHVVRTKDPCNPLQDLTDDEIHKCMSGNFYNALDFARAVIAAARAKNNLCERTK